MYLVYVGYYWFSMAKSAGHGSANINGKVIIRLTQPSLAWTGAELGKNKMNMEKLHGLGAVLGTISILVWFGNTIS